MRFTLSDINDIIKAENGLQIYISPNTTKDKNLFNLLNFKEKSILKQFKDYKFDNDNQTENDRKEFVSTVSGIYMNISEIGNKIVTNGIKKVELPDGSFVDDKNLIYEFVSNSSASFVSEIHTKIKELNDIGLPKELEYICPYCNYKWKDVFYGFNQSDFFGLSS